MVRGAPSDNNESSRIMVLTDNEAKGPLMIRCS